MWWDWLALPSSQILQIQLRSSLYPQLQKVSLAKPSCSREDEVYTTHLAPLLSKHL